jgi:hypothetical protein
MQLADDQDELDSLMWRWTLSGTETSNKFYDCIVGAGKVRGFFTELKTMTNTDNVSKECFQDLLSFLMYI